MKYLLSNFSHAQYYFSTTHSGRNGTFENSWLTKSLVLIDRIELSSYNPLYGAQVARAAEQYLPSQFFMMFHHGNIHFYPKIYKITKSSRRNSDA